jgi:hypothetical protein
MNPATPQWNMLLNNIGAANGSLRSSCGITRASDGHNQSHHDNFQRIAVRATCGLYSIANAAKVAIRNVEVIESIHEKFLSRERLYQIATAHARNSQPARWNDCTAFLHRKMNLFARCSVSSLRETRASLSKVFAFLFLSLKINHLRRLPPDQVL